MLVNFNQLVATRFNMTQECSSLFQKYCQRAIEKLTEKDIEDFKLLKDEQSRIKFLYEFAKTIPITPIDNGKDFLLAQKEKTQGNSFFSIRNYDNALKSYNNGILKCPQDTNESRELLTILISNRSATFFELKQYKNVFNDIDYVLEIGNYPRHLEYKIWLRKANCYKALQNEKSSSEAYDQAIESLKYANLSQKDMENKLKDIEKIRDLKLLWPTSSKELTTFHSHQQNSLLSGGEKYVYAHANVAIEEDQIQGRYARAFEDFQTGEIIVEENPHAAVLSPSNMLLNCQHCFAPSRQPFACPDCAHVIFCSSNCEKTANRLYHKYECPVQDVLIASGASVNCFVALRIITQKDLKFFKDKNKVYRDFLKDSSKRNRLEKKKYHSDDYETVFFLCRNENLRKKEELIHYGCMAIYLLRLIKRTGFFDYDANDDVLTDCEQYIGSLILRHLQILQFNLHEISELQNTNFNDVKNENSETTYTSVHIGAGLYPTLALFNHSCDPSVIRYNVGNKVIVKTIKPIKAGEIIYENYGPIYTTTVKEKRQNYLQERYWFECLCNPCVELWPLLDEMDERELRVPCKNTKCPFVFTLDRSDCDPVLICSYCNQVTGLFPILKNLMALQNILPEAEEYYGRGDFMNASEKYMQALNILYQNTSPPCPDIVKVQQRLRTCNIHLGNKAIDYVIKF